MRSPTRYDKRASIYIYIYTHVYMVLRIVMNIVFARSSRKSIRQAGQHSMVQLLWIQFLMFWFNSKSVREKNLRRGNWPVRCVCQFQWNKEFKKQNQESDLKMKDRKVLQSWFDLILNFQPKNPHRNNQEQKCIVLHLHRNLSSSPSSGSGNVRQPPRHGEPLLQA